MSVYELWYRLEKLGGQADFKVGGWRVYWGRIEDDSVCLNAQPGSGQW